MNSGFTYSYDCANIKLDCFYDGIELTSYISNLLGRSIKLQRLTQYDPFTETITWDDKISNICCEVCDCIKSINNDVILQASIASRLYEGFTGFWDTLLVSGYYTSGINFWKKVLEVTYGWEKINDLFNIHKGTPYFFLAETYLIVGDRDLGFTYLYNAIEEDIKLSNIHPKLQYPDESPAYLTATMRIGGNRMNYLIRNLRTFFSRYVDSFNNDFKKSNKFTLSDFDQKFLNNKNLINIVNFFVYNIWYLSLIEKNLKIFDLNNQFSSLRSLDLIFNLCLIVDETLKEAGRISGKNIDKISSGIMFLNNKNGWMSQTDLEDFWSKGLAGNIPKDDPDTIIPSLLSGKLTHNSLPIPNEIISLMITYNLRNYGGHNINQQKVLSDKFNEIIDHLVKSMILVIGLL